MDIGIELSVVSPFFIGVFLLQARKYGAKCDSRNHPILQEPSSSTAGANAAIGVCEWSRSQGSTLTSKATAANRIMRRILGPPDCFRKKAHHKYHKKDSGSRSISCSSPSTWLPALARDLGKYSLRPLRLVRSLSPRALSTPTTSPRRWGSVWAPQVSTQPNDSNRSSGSPAWSFGAPILC